MKIRKKFDLIIKRRNSYADYSKLVVKWWLIHISFSFWRTLHFLRIQYGQFFKENWIEERDTHCAYYYWPLLAQVQNVWKQRMVWFLFRFSFVFSLSPNIHVTAELKVGIVCWYLVNVFECYRIKVKRCDQYDSVYEDSQIVKIFMNVFIRRIDDWLVWKFLFIYFWVKIKYKKIQSA